MNILKIIFLSISSEITLFFLTKIMGDKQMSQISMFDYIIGITIGSIAAEMATSLENNFIEPLVAMIVYALIALTISYISYKSIKIRRILYGNSLILLDNGMLYMKNFKIAKLDINEFLVECRTSGYFNINDIETAILEPNGKISFLPKSSKKPITPEILNIKPQIEKALINIIIDGHILQENLEKTGNDMLWLQKQLSIQGITDISNVLLGMCDSNNILSIYTKKEFSNSHDFFE